MKALVEETGRVAQIVANDKMFPVASPLRWVDAPAGTTPQHTYDGAEFVPPAPSPAPGPDPNTELDAALAGVQAGLANVATIASLKASLNDTIDAMRGKAGRAGRIAGRPI